MSELVDRFQLANREQSITLEHFLSVEQDSLAAQPDRRQALADLACADLTLRWQSRPVEPEGTIVDAGSTVSAESDRPTVEDYVRQFPELAEPPLQLVLAEYAARVRAGGSVEHAELTGRFPHLASQLPTELTRIDSALNQEPGHDKASRTDPDAGSETIAQPAEPPRNALSETLIVDNAQGPSPTLHENADADPATLAENDGNSAPPVRGPRGMISRIGDYVILNEIARGGMGVVYKARQVRLNRVVALKMILQGQLAADEDIQRFYSEAEAAARLEHAGIVPVYEVGEFQGQHYFSMGFVDGESLSDRVRRGPLPPREAAALMRDVADAIDYAHRQGIVHRDLKPGNILLTRDGQPRVTDFGLAKAVEEDSGLTASGQVLGTPSYMPPEQASGRVREVGPQSDLYSLGALLYCLLAGRPPFQCATVVETLQQVMDAVPVSLKLLNPAVDRDLETITMKCLEKQPAHRLESAAELRDELQRYLDGVPIRSRPLGVTTRVWRWCRRKPLAAALIASVIVLAAAVTLTVQLAQSAAATRVLAGLQSDFEQAIDAPQATAAWLQETTELADRIAAQPDAPTDPVEQRKRITSTFAGLIQSDLRRPKLNAERAGRIQAAIDLLKPRAPAEADELQLLLERRLTDWLVDFEFAAPFSLLANDDRSAESDSAAASLNTVFAQQSVSATASGLLAEPGEAPSESESDPADSPVESPGAASIAQRVQTAVACVDDVELEAVFGAGWRTATETGVCLNCAASDGYDFVVKQLARPRVPANDDGTPTPDLRQSVAELRRNGVPLLRRSLDPKVLDDETLQIRARRVQGRIEFQINSAEPFHYYDPFWSGQRDSGHFAVLWPAGVTIKRILARHRPRPQIQTGLELADDLYAQQQFDAAAEQFRRQLAEADERAVREEARYKLGMCLVALQRTEEAVEVFSPLMAESDSQWGALAGVQLWLSSLRRHAMDDADAVFELLQSRYRYEELATLIPTKVREEIVDQHMKVFASVSSTLKFDEHRVRNMERAAAVDRLLSPDGLGDYWNQMELVRVYRFTNNLNRALATLEPLLERGTNVVAVRHYCRILRLLDRQHDGLRKLDELLSHRATGNLDMDEGQLQTLRIDRARIFYDLGNTDAAENDLRLLLKLLDQADKGRHPDFHSRALATLMLGFLLEDRGQDQAALQVWRTGFQKCRTIYQQLRSAFDTSLISTLVMGSLCGDLSVHDANEFTRLVSGANSGGSIVSMASSLVTPQTVADAMRGMWHTPRGRNAAREFAFETLTLSERTQLPVVLLGHSFFRQKAFDRAMTSEQDEALWQFLLDGHRAAFDTGELKLPQLMQLALTWKGSTSFVGWGGVAPTLPREFRATAAWVLGHRFIRLGQHDEARRFFQTAVADGENSPVAGFAREALKQLDAGQARLVLHTDHSVKPDHSIHTAQPGLNVTLQDGDRIVSTVSLDHSSEPAGEILIPAGDYDVTFNMAGLPAVAGSALTAPRVADGANAQADAGANRPSTSYRVHLPLASTARLDIAARWAPDDGDVLPGMVPRPASLSGLGRWQIVRDQLPGSVSASCWSPDGSIVAVAPTDCSIRLYDPRTWRPAGILLGHGSRLNSMRCSPDSRWLASLEMSGDLILWDLPGRRRHLKIPGIAGRIHAFAWHPDSQSIVLTAWGQPGLTQYGLDGTVLQQVDGQTAYAAMAWSRDGRLLAASRHGAKQLCVWSCDTEGKWSSAPDIHRTQEQIHLLAWHADGKLLAASGPESVQLWDADAWQPLNSWPVRHANWLAWNEAENTLWAANWEQRVQQIALSDLNHSATATTIETPEAWAGLALSPSGQLLRGGQNSFRVFQPDGSTNHIYLTPEDLSCHQLSWSTDGKLLAAAFGRYLTLIRIARAEPGRSCLAELISCQPVENAVAAMSWSPDQNQLACGFSNGTLRLLSSEGQLLSETRCSAGISDLAWRPDGSGMLVAVKDGTLVPIPANGEPEEPLVRDTGNLRAIAISPDGRLVAAVGNGHVAHVWTMDGQPAFSIDTRSANSDVAWSANGETLAIASYHLHLVDTASQTSQRVSHNGSAIDVTFSPQSGKFLFRTDIQQFDQILPSGDDRRRFRRASGELAASSIRAADGLLAIGTVSGSIELISTIDGQPQGVLVMPRPDKMVVLSRSGEPLLTSVTSQNGAASPASNVSPASAASPTSTAIEASQSSGGLLWVVEEASGRQTTLTESDFLDQLQSGPQEATRFVRGLQSRSETTEPVALQPVGHLNDAGIEEASGLVRSQQHPNVYWTICDSGNPANLYALNRSGDVLAAYAIQDAKNFDWESLSLDSSGRLYLGDIGNLGKRSEREFYVVEEPDPAQAADSSRTNPAPLPVQSIIRFQCPAPETDFEASFVRDGSLWLISKVPFGRTELFELPVPAADSPLDQLQTLRRHSVIPDVNWITDATLSTDGRQLTLTTYTEVISYQLEPGELPGSLPAASARLPFEAPLIEAVTFEDDGLLLLSEVGSLHFLPLASRPESATAKQPFEPTSTGAPASAESQ